ncbi:MAG: 4-hydroxy-tetrahydrodipicolinate reductase [Flavobacteriaceae bacterium]|jgi:4-hydroxy-tetrahydrodipicolinate reductase|nr:4-hydroxy-tetrahydrodipicolinate reductase [Flavobacteriaceae bacterium]MBT6128234.1 4-hydroxy-tetrahydrodipicolinate reductase [Flavobacteriaceae bacterium]MDG1027648.1 4-hydroxy-tetrahydrodipicolinate reductase [Flavobacteriaceae bacterium]MDG1940795.1 4-hydroxy-tetrahydrodipicolinate reductase [Flavobacteriaceae bacterium]
MKFALLGYGRMGKAIEQIALDRGHQIVCKIDKNLSEGKLHEADAAINFSIPDAAADNISSALNQRVPVVCGTTGWLDAYQQVTQTALEKNTAFLYASNFSVGVNLFFKLNKVLAQMMHPHKEYRASMEETHHIHKLDAPSGTAITLAEGIIENSDLIDWKLDEDAKDSLSIQSYREGEVPGTHSIKYKSTIDDITIEHKAHNRKGFALGAVIAAEWIVGKKGIFKMDDVLNL